MVKNFEEFVNESKLIGEAESSKETPECLLKIVDFINSKTLKTNISKDGRVSSIKDEDDCINLLRTSDDWDVIDEKYESGDKMTIVVPKSREWYDIEIIDNGKHYYVNIKSSTFKSYDNVGSPSFILYGLFGKMKSIKDMSTAEKYAELYLEYNRREETGYDDVSAYDIIKDIKDGEHLTLDEVDKLTKYKNAVLVFMSSKDIYVLEDKYKELVNKD